MAYTSTINHRFTAGYELVQKNFDFSPNIQTYTVPITGTYTIVAAGASGAAGNKYNTTFGSVGGKGAWIKADFTLTAGTVLKVITGGRGYGTTGTASDGSGGGAGGGTFVFRQISSITNSKYQIAMLGGYYECLLVAAGGGGAGDESYKNALVSGANGKAASYYHPGNYSAFNTTVQTANAVTSSNSLTYIANQYTATSAPARITYTRNGSTGTGGYGGGGVCDDSQSAASGWNGNNTSGATSWTLSTTNALGVDGCMSDVDGWAQIVPTGNQNGSWQTFVVPSTGYWEIKGYGAAGAPGNQYRKTGAIGGKGAIVTSDFLLHAGDELTIICGRVGTCISGSAYDGSGGGSGGAAIVLRTIPAITDSRFQFTRNSKNYEVLLVAPGGGGGNDQSYQNTSVNGSNGLLNGYCTPGMNYKASGTSNTSVFNQLKNNAAMYASYTRGNSVGRGGYGFGAASDDGTTWGASWDGAGHAFCHDYYAAGSDGGNAGNGIVEIRRRDPIMYNMAVDGWFTNNHWSGGERVTSPIRPGTSYSYKLHGSTTAYENVAPCSDFMYLQNTHLYYFRMYSYYTDPALKTGGASVGVYWPIAEPSFRDGFPLGPANTWTMHSILKSQPSFTTGSYQFRIDFNNQKIEGDMYFSSILMFDVTEFFGAGNEPDQAWLDKFLPDFKQNTKPGVGTYYNLIPNGGFESTSTVSTRTETWEGCTYSTTYKKSGERSSRLNNSGTQVNAIRPINVPIVGHNYYGRHSQLTASGVTLTVADCRFELFGGDGDGLNWVFGWNNHTTNGTWFTESAIHNIHKLATTDTNYVIRNFTVNPNNYVYTDELMMCDLTVSFGRNELIPAKTWMDNLPYTDWIRPFNYPPNISVTWANIANKNYTINDAATALGTGTSVTHYGTLTYSWQKSSNGTSGWTQVATTATYTPPTNAVGTLYYRCVLTDTYGTTSDKLYKVQTSTSGTAKIVVSAPAIKLTPKTSYVGASYYVGDTATALGVDFNVYGVADIYWERSLNQTGSWETVSTTHHDGFPSSYWASASSYTPPTGDVSTYWYRFRVKNTLNQEASTTPVKIEVQIPQGSVTPVTGSYQSAEYIVTQQAAPLKVHASLFRDATCGWFASEDGINWPTSGLVFLDKKQSDGAWEGDFSYTPPTDTVKDLYYKAVVRDTFSRTFEMEPVLIKVIPQLEIKNFNITVDNDGIAHLSWDEEEYAEKYNIYKNDMLIGVTPVITPLFEFPFPWDESPFEISSVIGVTWDEPINQGMQYKFAVEAVYGTYTSPQAILYVYYINRLDFKQMKITPNPVNTSKQYIIEVGVDSEAVCRVEPTPMS